MVRRCVVSGCSESDQTLLAHRFPKIPEVAETWRKALDLGRFTIEDIQKRFVVCTRHFSSAAYRNEISNSLNTTAVPNLNDNATNERIHNRITGAKKQPQLPARCYKLPDMGSRENQQQQLAKRVKIMPQIISDYIVTNENIKFVTEEVDEEETLTFEVMDYDEDEVEAEGEAESDVEPEAEVHPEAEVEPEVVPGSLYEQTALDESADELEVHEEPELPQPPQPSREKLAQFNQETQTDPEPIKPLAPPIDSSLAQLSKDDKLIRILYPEFCDVGKIQLVELIAEKSRRIESLEEKVKKLEQAMRNLL